MAQEETQMNRAETNWAVSDGRIVQFITNRIVIVASLCILLLNASTLIARH